MEACNILKEFSSDQILEDLTNDAGEKGISYETKKRIWDIADEIEWHRKTEQLRENIEHLRFMSEDERLSKEMEAISKPHFLDSRYHIAKVQNVLVISNRQSHVELRSGG